MFWSVQLPELFCSLGPFPGCVASPYGGLLEQIGIVNPAWFQRRARSFCSHTSDSFALTVFAAFCCCPVGCKCHQSCPWRTIQQMTAFISQLYMLDLERLTEMICRYTADRIYKFIVADDCLTWACGDPPSNFLGIKSRIGSCC